MTEYWLGPESGCLCATPLFKTDLSFFTIMTIDEFTKQKKNLPITRRFFIIWVLSATVKRSGSAPGLSALYVFPKRMPGILHKCLFVFILRKKICSLSRKPAILKNGWKIKSSPSIISNPRISFLYSCWDRLWNRIPFIFFIWKKKFF